MRFTTIWMLSLALATGGMVADPKPLNIFVSIGPQVTFTERIGGDRVRVEAMVQPGHSPATYQPSPRQMTRLSHTDLYLSIGVPFETAWLKRLETIHPHMRRVDVTEGIKRLTMDTHHHGLSLIHI